MELGELERRGIEISQSSYGHYRLMALQEISFFAMNLFMTKIYFITNNDIYDENQNLSLIIIYL